MMLKLSGVVHSSLSTLLIFNRLPTTFNVAMATALSHTDVTKFQLFDIIAHFSQFLDKIDTFRVPSALVCKQVFVRNHSYDNEFFSTHVQYTRTVMIR